MLAGGKLSGNVPVFYCAKKASPKVVAAGVQMRKQDGYKHFQVKIGSKMHDDVEMCKSMRELLEPHDILVADANGGNVFLCT